MVRTGASAYSQYEKEVLYGVDPVGDRDLVFGLEEKISGWAKLNNQIMLSKFNQITVDQFAYGQNSGRYTIDYVLSNPWWLELIFGVIDAGVGPFTHTYTPNSTLSSFTHEIGMGLQGEDQVRTILGAVLNSATIRSSMNELVRCSAEVVYGKEAAVGTSLDSTPSIDDLNFPYTFVHGTIEKPNSTVLAEVQSIELTINQNAELLYGHGDADPVGAFKRRLDMSGRVNLSLVDATHLDDLNARAEVATMRLKFSNGLTDTAEKTIDFALTGIGFGEHGLGSVEPNEPIFEDLNYVARNVSIVATNNIASAP